MSSVSFWSYIDVYDLAHALRLACECVLHDWHEAVYVVSADNGAGRPLRELIAHHFAEDVELRSLPREDAGGISYAKAHALLGFEPRRTWRDYLTEEGKLVTRAQSAMERGDTGVQRGRRALS